MPADSPAAPAAAVGADPGADAPDPNITIDDFAKVQLRVAEVLSAERVPRRTSS
jgi:methionyl-tRNA synthetase